MTFPLPTTLPERLALLDDAQLRQMRRGVEKESLRAQPDGALACTPHPLALGSALRHPQVTTDFSESQIEIVTGAHLTPQACADELTRLHQAVYRAIGEERLWVSSMPCSLPVDEAIPIARYGLSNIGRAKSVYRMGLSHRYGRRMQTISGIHYNWSMPGLSSADYFALIRNVRRHAFVLLLLTGASPAVCARFIEGRPHELQRIGWAGTLHGTWGMRHGTSLRMGRLGYQSDAQATLSVSYNCLEGYTRSLQDALTRPYLPYEQLGVRNLGGEYNQLSTTLLQIENEFYGVIRPKRVIRPGERPLHALRQRGVEYVEVRCIDLDPFEPTGISAQTMRLIDLFLLHSLLAPSPADCPAEIAEIAHNQHLTAARGRERGLLLRRGGVDVPLIDWAGDVLRACEPLAERLDALHGDGLYTEALTQALHRLAAPQDLPSARVLQHMAERHQDSHVGFVRAQSDAAREALRALPLDADWLAAFDASTAHSLAQQAAQEAAEREPFETFRQHYLDPAQWLT